LAGIKSTRQSDRRSIL